MKSRNLTLLPLAALAGFAFTASWTNAATFSTSTTTPTVDGADIANLSSTDWDWGSSTLWSDRPARGQTFTTASDAGGYTLNAITLQAGGDQSDNGDYIIRVSSVSGSTLTPLATETTGVVTLDVSDGTCCATRK